MCVIFGQGKEHQKRIIVDVGHGGKDPVAIGVNGSKGKGYYIGNCFVNFKTFREFRNIGRNLSDTLQRPAHFTNG